MLVISILTLLVAVSFGYAYFDKLSNVQSPSIQIGDWMETYFTGFETYKTKATSYKDPSNLSVTWNFVNVNKTGNASKDNFLDSRSLRLQGTASSGTSSISSSGGFKGPKYISFYFGRANNTTKKEGSQYEVFIKVGSGSFFSIQGPSVAPISFGLVTIPLDFVYTQGLGGATRASIIDFRIVYYGIAGTNLNKIQAMNIDNLTVFHSK